MRKMPAPSAERVERYRRGLLSEWVAAAVLMAKGYRMLGRRVRTPFGEIDLIAVRAKRLAFVEVKRRATRAEGEAAITPRQAARIARAAEFWVSRNRRYVDHEQGLDVVLVMPNRLPVHVPNALHLMPAGPRNRR
jgi:putative endonuclease